MLNRGHLSWVVILTLEHFLTLVSPSISPNTLSALKNNCAIIAITPDVSGLVLFDPKKEVRTHPGTCPFATQECEPCVHLYSSLVIVYVKDGKFYYVSDEHGQVLIPSYISFVNGPNNNNNNNNNNNPAAQILVGQEAKAQLVINPVNTIFNWKHLFRLRYGDPIVQFEINHKRVPYKIVSFVPTPPPSLTTHPTPDVHPTEPTQPNDTKDNQHFLGLAMIQLTDTHNKKYLYRPEELTAFLVFKIKELAEDQSGRTFANAYATIPSSYTDGQRWALQETLLETGLYPSQLISRHHLPAVGHTARKELEENEVYVSVLVNLDPEYIEIAVTEMEDHIFDTLGFAAQPANIRFDNKMANCPVVEFLVDQHLNRLSRNTYGRLWERSAQDVMGHLSTSPENTLFHRTAILNDPITMKRLKDEIRKINKVFTGIFSSVLNNVVRIEIEALFDGQDFSELLSLSRWQELRQATLEPILLETMEKAFKRGSIGQDTVNMVIVARASPLVPDDVRLLKRHFHGQNVDIPSLTNPALATLEGANAIMARYPDTLGFGS